MAKAADKGTRSGGWSGKILQVDLSNARVWEEELSEELKSGYTGGAGVNARLLYDLVRANPQLDPLSPENLLIFGFGILAGTTFPCAPGLPLPPKALSPASSAIPMPAAFFLPA